MKSTLLVLLLTVFVWCLASTSSFSKEDTAVAIPEKNSESFANLSEADQMQLALQLVQERLDFQNNLLKQLAPETPIDIKEKIIFLLGYYRYESAVPFIARYIDLKHEQGDIVRYSYPMISPYPAVDALINIGTRSAPEMLKNIETSENDNISDLSVFVLKGVYGVELARCYLQIALEKQKDTTIKGRLSQAIEKLSHEHIIKELVPKTIEKLPQ